MVGTVDLRRVDEEILRGLLALAVNDADPGEVMPPVAGPPGWTAERREAFRAWHRARRPGLTGPLRECTFAIIEDVAAEDTIDGAGIDGGGRIVGSARLACRENRDVLETGMWLARSARGRGVGTAALRALLDQATTAGATLVVADTTSTNFAALSALRRNHATITPEHNSVRVHAVLSLTRSASPNP